MTEFDQESYGAGYKSAEWDISHHGIKYAEDRLALVESAPVPPSEPWLLVGYRTCVQGWKEGVRL